MSGEMTGELTEEQVMAAETTAVQIEGPGSTSDEDVEGDASVPESGEATVIPAIEASDEPAEAKHDQSVAHLTAQADELGVETATQLQNVVTERATPQHPEREVFERKYKDVQQAVLEKHQQQLQQLIAQNQTEQAVQLLQALTDATKDDLSALRTTEGSLDPAQVDGFLAQRLKQEVVIDALARFSEAHAAMKDAKTAVEAEDQVEAQSDGEASGGLVSEETEEGRFDAFLDWYQDFDKDSQELLDKVDVPGLMRMIFAIEGYGSSWNAYKNGLEAKDEDKEIKTLASLTKVFGRTQTAEVFLKRLVGKEVDANLSPDELLNLLEEILSIPAGADAEQQAEKLKLIKQNMIEGFGSCTKLGLSLSVKKEEDLNLSAEVMQFLLLNTHKYAEKSRRQTSESKRESTQDTEART